MCDQCGKDFLTASGLRRHVIRVHCQSRMSFKCEICNGRFAEKAELQTHMSSKHASEKTYHCNACSRMFARKDTLTRHLSVHLPASFKCDHCLKTFNRKDNLKEHIKTAHQNKTHQCQKCGKQYKWNSSLVRHQTEQH